MQIGMIGEGFEPTIEALFGENGFFPDTALKTMYFVSENMPQPVNEILENAIPALKRNSMKREVLQATFYTHIYSSHVFWGGEVVVGSFKKFCMFSCRPPTTW